MSALQNPTDLHLLLPRTCPHSHHCTCISCRLHNPNSQVNTNWQPTCPLASTLHHRTNKNKPSNNHQNRTCHFRHSEPFTKQSTTESSNGYLHCTMPLNRFCFWAPGAMHPVRTVIRLYWQANKRLMPKLVPNNGSTVNPSGPLGFQIIFQNLTSPDPLK